MDYNNIFSGDYWSPDGYRRRKEEERADKQKLAIAQDKSNRAPWEAIGGFLGDSARNIGDFIGSANQGPAPAARAATNVIGRFASTGAFNPRMERTASGGDTRMSPTFIDDLMNGRLGPGGSDERTHPALLGGRDSGSDPAEDELNAREILERLGQKFSFDRDSVDTSPLDEVLNNNINQLNGVRDTTNQNFQESDRNINAMFSAHQADVKNDTPEIQARGEANTKAVGGIFDKTIQENNAQLAQERKTEEEMLRRLGIAPAANQPDLMGQAIVEGNNQAAASRDTRMAESRTNTQTDVSRNNTLASAVGNDGLQRRSDLNMRLQEILGNLGEKEADYRNDYQQNRLALLQGAEDKSYDRWLQDRQFDMGLFDSVNQANAAGVDSQAERDHEIRLQELKNAGRSSGGGSGSSAGWLQGASPEFQNAFFDVAQQVDIERNPQEAIRRLADPKYGLNPSEVVTKIKDYTNLGKVTPMENLG